MVSIIIINYKQKDFLSACVESIYQNFKSYPFEVIIVNNSPEDDLSVIAGKFSVKILNNENRGFSHANNFGAKNSSGQYLLFLNADTIIKNDFLMNAVNEFNQKENGAIGLKLHNDDGTFQLSFWRENTFLNEIKNKKNEKAFKQSNKLFVTKFEAEFSVTAEVDWVTGAAIIIPQNVFDKVGGFDEKFFLFYEDADICKRIKTAGSKIIFYPFSDIIHFKGENVNVQFADQTYFYAKQSQLLYYKKHNSILNRISIRVYLIIKFLLLYVFTLKKIYLRILLLAFGVRNAT